MIVDELNKLGIDVKPWHHGDVKVVCPKCSASRRNKRDPCLSVNVDRGIWNCHNCSWAGGIKPDVKKEYTLPPQELKKLSQPVIDWFADRKITNQTLLRYGVTAGLDYMPQVNKEVGCIHFNYFYDGKLLNVKYRDREKNFKLFGGAALLPYGIDVALDNSRDEIAIVEGECDALALYECGIKIAVSVPNGASKGSQKLEWLDEWYHIFAGKKVYLAVDMDDAGLSLRNELARRIGKHNCWVVDWPEKDANDTLIKYNKDIVVQCFENAHQFPVDGIEDAESGRTDLIDLWSLGNPEGCDTGWDMDESFLWFPGQVTLLTGIPGHGKTTWLKNLMCRLAHRNEWKFFVYSAEEAGTSYALSDLISIHTNKPFFNTPGIERISKEQVEQMIPYLTDRFKYYSVVDGESTIEAVIEKGEEVVRRFGVNAIVIDNMSSLERRLSKGSDNRHHEIGNILSQIVKFSRHYSVHVFIVAHPKKMSKLNSRHEVPTGYDVGDSSHYYNKPDNGITVYRNKETGVTELHRWKVRYRYTGVEGVDYFKYNPITGRLESTENINDGKDKTKFIGQPAEQKVSAFIAAGLTPGKVPSDKGRRADT